MSEKEWKMKSPEKSPSECEWSENCDREPTTNLYEWTDTDEELWVCEGHFSESMYRKPPSEINIQDQLICEKCGSKFEKIEDYAGKKETGQYESTCDCEHLEGVTLSIE